MGRLQAVIYKAPQEELLWDISQLLRGLALSVGRPRSLTGGAVQTGGAAAGHLGRVMPGACQQLPSSLWPPFLPEHTDGPLPPGLLLKVPRIHPRDVLLRASAAGCTLAKNSQTWAWKGQDGGWGAAVLGPSPRGYLGVWRRQLPCPRFSFHSLPGAPGLIIRNFQVTGTLALTLGLAKGQRTCQNPHLGDLMLMTSCLVFW